MKKKLIALLLAISACFSMASCDVVKDKLSGLPVVGGLFGKDDSSTDSSSDSSVEEESGYDLEGAKALLDARVKVENAESREEYEVPASVLLEGVTYTVEWSVNVDSVKIEKDADKVYVNVYEASLSLEDVNFVLTAKLTDPDGNSIESNMNRVVPKLERYVPAKITEKPAENVAYKFNVYQGKNKHDVYIDGNMKNTWYFSTVTDGGLDVYVEYVEGSETDFYLYHMIGEEGETQVKEYINVVPNGSHVNAVYGNPDVANFPDFEGYTGTLQTPFYFYEEWQTIATDVNGTRYYLGCDGTYDTVEPQKDEGNDYFKGYLVTEVDRLNVDEKQKIEHEYNMLNLAPAFVGGGESATLLSHGDRYPDVKITWNLNNSEIVSKQRNVLSFNTVEAVEEVTLTATLKIGNETKTKDVTFKVVPNNAQDIIDTAAAFQPGEAFGNEVTMTGLVLRITDPYEQLYDNVSFIMLVGEDKVIGYHAKGEGADVVARGFTVTCSGKFMNYNGKLEFSPATLESYEIGDETNIPENNLPANDSTLTIPDVLALDMSQYYEETYYVEGTISYIKDAEAAEKGRFYIKDANGNSLYVYGTEKQYEDIAVGDKVKCYAPISSYDGKNQLVEAVVTLIEKGEVTPPSDNEGETTPTTPEEILNALYALADGETLEGSFTLTGKITALDNFNNPTIVVEGFEDKPVYCYYLRVENAVNDVITVTATKMKNHGGIYEFMNCTLVSGEVTPPADDSNAITAPEAGKAYAMSLYQVTLGKTLYLAGGLDDSEKYLATTENESEAISVYAEAADGGYKFYVLDDNNNKTYIHLEEYLKDSGYYGARTSWQADGTVFTYDEVGCWATTLANDTFFLGTYNNYNTVSASGSYYMTAANMGTSQFPLLLIDLAGSDDNQGGNVTPPADDDDNTDDDTVATEQDIVDQLYALGSGETIANATLTGVVVAITEPYSSYGNSTFLIAVADREDKLVTCFRLTCTADTAPQIGDVVTVTGTLTNYNGTREFDKTSTFVAVDTYAMTDAQKLLLASNELVLATSSFDANVSVVLPTTTVDGVTVTWAADKGTISEGVLTYTATETTKIKLTATLTVGETTKTKEFTISATLVVEGNTLPSNLVFTDLVNKTSADDYLKANYADWTITGKLGKGYGGYLGFGRDGDKQSSITSGIISVSSEFTVQAVLKGNGSNKVMTSTLTFTLIDANGDVVATGYADGVSAICPPDAEDTTYSISFTFVDGKTWTDVSNLKIDFAKTTGNIGLKSLDFVTA